MADKESKSSIIARNKKAYHDFHILETYEAGLALQGTEVKSLRAGKCSMRESFGGLDAGEVFLYDLHIPPYSEGNIHNHEPKRKRKLLMHKGEIQRLIGKVAEKGLTLVPTKIYFNDRGKAKVEIALAVGKKLYDKRQDIATKDAKRDIDRALRERQKDQ